MKTQTLLSVILIATLSVACDQTEFKAAGTAAQAYRVSMKGDAAPSGDSTVEGPSSDAKIGTTDSKSSTIDSKSNNDKIKEKKSDDTKGDDDDQECAEISGVAMEHIKVTGDQKHIELSQGQALAVKVTGNHSVVDIDLKALAPTDLVKAICVIVRGNTNIVNIGIANHVGLIYVNTRGNSPVVTIKTLKGSVIDEIKLNNRSSKGPELFLEGEGMISYDKANAGISRK